MKNNTFIITTPVFNAAPWVEHCISSIINQSYNNWKLCIVNDSSSDGTLDVISKFGNHPQIKIINNANRCGTLHNHILAIKSIGTHPEEIIVNVDGDDWLAGNDVLEYLNNVYQDNNIWCTYGEYQALSGDPSQNRRIYDSRNYRRSRTWYTSHLRTYKKHIWDRIKNSDFVGPDGRYFQIAPDLAIMYPIIEMCGTRRIKPIDKILYIYNDHNPLNEFKANPRLLETIREYIWNKPVYNEL